jgi:GT2 family glycosyltransferase
MISAETKPLIIIPVFGKESFTKKCIELCIKHAGIDHDILVVDDCSPEPFSYDSVNILRLEKNLGFSGAANAGIIWAQKRNYEFIHILNNDTEPYADFLKILHNSMLADSSIGIACSSRRMNTREKHNIELFGSDLIRGNQKMTDSVDWLPNVIPTHWVALASAMYRMDMLREIGYFDKRMINWCSDNDICIRANFAGWKVVLVPKSMVFHYHQQTTGVTVGTEREKDVIADQAVFVEKLAGMQYAKLMNDVPLDCEMNTYGKLTFDVVTK